MTSYTLAGVDLNATIAVTAYDANATNLNDANSTLVNQPNGYESWFAIAASAIAAPAITTHPVSQAINTGTSGTFSVVATGTTPLSYQWQKDGVDIADTNASNYTLNSVAAGDAATYRVIVTNAAGSVTSNGAVLTVN